MKQKSQIVLLAAFALAAVGSVGLAQDLKPRVAVLAKPTVLKFFQTKVAGKIKVPAAPTGALQGFGCQNIIVSATSNEYNTPPGGGFGSPKWVRSVAATGDYASGSCSYSLSVPGGKGFYLSASGEGNYDCSVISTWIGPQGTTIGPLTVPVGTTKKQDFEITKVNCDIVT